MHSAWTLLSKSTRRKKIVALTNQIVDIELTKLSCFPNKFLVFSTKEFVIAFCLTKLFVDKTKIFLRRQDKVCQFYIFLRVNQWDPQRNSACTLISIRKKIVWESSINFWQNWEIWTSWSNRKTWARIPAQSKASFFHRKISNSLNLYIILV